MVNVTDFKDNDIFPKVYGSEDRLHHIFKRQRELMVKYEKIEKRNGLLQTDLIPVDLHCKNGQARLKDFAWRFTEELTEAGDAEGILHRQEELADALHFLIELCILVGIDDKVLYGMMAKDLGVEVIDNDDKTLCRLNKIWDRIEEQIKAVDGASARLLQPYQFDYWAFQSIQHLGF
jgi:hypothetical protein